MQWSVTGLERSRSDNVVWNAHWKLSKTQDGAYGSVNGIISFLLKDPADPTFIPYENLTESIILQWIHEVMGAQNILMYENVVNSQIDNQLNPKSANGVPWATDSLIQ